MGVLPVWIFVDPVEWVVFLTGTGTGVQGMGYGCQAMAPPYVANIVSYFPLAQSSLRIF